MTKRDDDRRSAWRIGAEDRDWVVVYGRRVPRRASTLHVIRKAQVLGQAQAPGQEGAEARPRTEADQR